VAGDTWVAYPFIPLTGFVVFVGEEQFALKAEAFVTVLLPRDFRPGIFVIRSHKGIADKVEPPMLEPLSLAEKKCT
jgi:hypothetical protein